MERSKELDNYSRKQIMHELFLSIDTKGKPTHEVMGEMSNKHKLNWKIISRIWGQVKQQQQNSFPINVNSKRIGKKLRSEIIFKFKGFEKASNSGSKGYGC